jgi:hypothetical protein
MTANLTLGWKCKCCGIFHPSGSKQTVTNDVVRLDGGKLELQWFLDGHVVFSVAHTAFIWAEIAIKFQERMESYAQRRQLKRSNGIQF